MKSIPLLNQNDKSIRTQITLTKKIKDLVEKEAKKKRESLSEYLRKAALLRWLVEREKKENLKEISQRVIGCVDLNKHPQWQTKDKLQKWLRQLRQEW